MAAWANISNGQNLIQYFEVTAGGGIQLFSSCVILSQSRVFLSVQLQKTCTFGNIAILRQLLQKHPSKRLGCGADSKREIMDHAFFRMTKWDKLAALEVQPPFKPKIVSRVACLCRNRCSGVVTSNSFFARLVIAKVGDKTIAYIWCWYSHIWNRAGDHVFNTG